MSAATGSALLSDDGLHRYWLTRRWADDGPLICWVMLNPSTADATEDDPTIRRCIGFSKAWGFGSLAVVNLFSLRSPNPRDLVDSAHAGIDPVGPLNDGVILRTASGSVRTIAAWGTKGGLFGRSPRVVSMLTAAGVSLYCLGRTQDGHPKHPLYVRGDTLPQVHHAADCATPASIEGEKP